MPLEFLFVLNVIVIPTLALIIPVLILAYHIISNNLELSLEKSKWIKFIGVWFLLTVLIFTLLLYLTGDLAYFFFLEPGIYPFNGGIQFNISKHIGLTLRYDPGTSLFVVAALSSLLYTALLVLPPVCTYVPQEISIEKATGGKTASVSSGVTATASAVASTAVCCSTSVVAVVAPTLIAFLGPFVPFLLVVSMLLLIYSFYKVVLPRFPVI